MHILFDTADVANVVRVRALGRIVAHVTLAHLFVVMIANVREQNVGSKYCHLFAALNRVDVFSNWVTSNIHAHIWH
jgi:hypothetical protein